MDYEKYINDFLDGRLSPESEQIFFSSLASSDDARSDFRQMLKIEKSMKSDAAKMQPSARSTIAVFDRLGFNVPSTPPEPGFFSRFSQGLGAFFSMRQSHVLTALMSSALTALIIFMFLPSVNAGDESDSASFHSAEYKPVQIEIPVVESFAGTSDNNNSTDKIIPSAKIDNENRVKSSFSNGSNDEITSPAMENDREINKENTSTDYELSGLMPELNKDDIVFVPFRSSDFTRPDIVFVPVQTEIAANLSPSVIPWEKIGLDIEFRGASYFDFPKADIPESSSPDLKNLNITGLFSIGKNFQIGADFRQEFFYQEFEGVNQGTLFRYRQYPNLFSAGILARYYLFQDGNLSSFLQGGLAFNRAGAVGRTMLGIRYMAGVDYGFVLGVEGSNLFYKHESSSFNAPKLGIHYGIIFCL